MNDVRTEQPARALPISVGAVTEVGRREQNQDCMTGFSSPFGAVYLIADGMGGHRGGAEASRLVAEAFSRHLQAVPASTPLRDAVTLACRLANVEVLEKGKSGNPEFEGMGSTVVIALVRQTDRGLELTTAHIGDSRIYLQRDASLTLLTKDHTQIQWLIDTNAIDEASARNHPDASVLTRAMGHTTDLKVDISDPIPLREGDGILLCSDGLSGFASTEQIDRTIQQNPDPTGCANQLVQLALSAGSNDNITVQFLRIGGPAPAMPSRGRSRTTEPEGPLPPTASTVKSPWRWIIAAAVLAIVAAIILWFRFHSPGGEDPAHQLDLRIKNLNARVSVASGSADKYKKEVENDLKHIADLSEPHERPSGDLAKLQRDFTELNGKLEKFINTDCYNLQDAIKNNYSPAMASIQKEDPSSPTRKDDINKLAANVSAAEGKAKKLEDDLAFLKGQKDDFEGRLAKASPTAAPHAQPRTPPAHPAHPQPEDADQ